MPDSLSYELHKLTALALFAVREGAASQRELAAWLGQTEPSTSRMVGILAGERLLEASVTAGAGNRRQLRLTAAGGELVERCGRLLEGRFEELVTHSGVPYAAYQRHTRRLLAQLDAEQHAATGSRVAAS